MSLSCGLQDKIDWSGIQISKDFLSSWLMALSFSSLFVGREHEGFGEQQNWKGSRFLNTQTHTEREREREKERKKEKRGIEQNASERTSECASWRRLKRKEGELSKVKEDAARPVCRRDANLRLRRRRNLVAVDYSSTSFWRTFEATYFPRKN